MNWGSINLRRLPETWTAGDEALVQTVDDATATPIYVTYRLAGEWFEGVHAVLDTLEAQLRNRPRIVLALLERAAFRLDHASGSVDDSDGGMIEAGARLYALLLACVDAADLSPADADVRFAKLAPLELWPDTEGSP